MVDTDPFLFTPSSSTASQPLIHDRIRLYLLGLSFATLATHAQDPFAAIGRSSEVLTLGHGQYQEVFANDTLRRIGAFVYNTITEEAYCFGFQGQEKDDEVHGSTGTSYAFEHRIHDPRVGRFLSLDPLAAKYPWSSPYSFSFNRVIDYRELEGLEGIPAGKINAELGLGTITSPVDATYTHQTEWDSQLNYPPPPIYPLQADPLMRMVIETIMPVAEINQLITGEDENGQRASRAAAAGWLILSFVPGERIANPILRVTRSVGRGLETVGFKNAERLADHFTRHASEFDGAYKTADEYEKGAKDFLNSASDDAFEYTRTNGDFVKYNAKTNTFGVADKDGTIKTFFKPEEGSKYFEEQLTKDFPKATDGK